jgi:hypothetical protein
VDEQKEPASQEKEPELRRPDEAVKDLEPEEQESEAVKGGSFSFGASNPSKMEP